MAGEITPKNTIDPGVNDPRVTEVSSSEETQSPSNPIKKTEGSYMGRFVRWLNETPGGRFTKGVGNVLAAVAVAAVSLLILKAAISVAIFSVLACATVVAIPLGLAGFACTGVLIAMSVKTFEFAGTLLRNAIDDFSMIKKLSMQEA